RDLRPSGAVPCPCVLEVDIFTIVAVVIIASKQHDDAARRIVNDRVAGTLVRSACGFEPPGLAVIFPGLAAAKEHHDVSNAVVGKRRRADGPWNGAAR